MRYWIGSHTHGPRQHLTAVGRICKLLLTALAFVALLAPLRPAKAEVALLMEEPYGQFGAFNPTGHAAIYLSNICAANPARLRRCYPGEYGVVISRYHKIHHQDWLAIPLTDYLYAVDSIDAIPTSATKESIAALRNAYWRNHLTDLAPAKSNGEPPNGEWTQLVGASYDRKIFAFAVDTTSEQDDHFIALLNDSRNVSHFNLFFHNCADFSRVAINTYYPAAIRRNVFSDFGITTPKHVARSLFKFGRKHPELSPATFEIAQIPGTAPRSHAIHGVSESVVKSMKYFIPLAILSPEAAGAVMVYYLAEGRSSLPQTATAFTIQDWQIPNPLSNPKRAATPSSQPTEEFTDEASPRPAS
jgi:hypothetical protein